MGCRGRGWVPFPCAHLSETLACFLPWHHSQHPAIESSDGNLREVDGEPAVVLGQQAHPFRPQHLTQKHIVLLPTEITLVPNTPYQHGLRILGLGYARRERSRGRLIDRPRRLHLERFMWTNLVVFLAKDVQGPLLLSSIPRGRLCGLLLQRAMHALVAPVLLRMSRSNALRGDPQLDPPHRQPRQPRHGRGRKGRPVIGADRFRHSVLAKSGLKDGLHLGSVGLLHRLAAQQVPAVSVRNGQWIDALPVPRAKPALEIRTPHAVRFVRVCQRLAVGSRPGALPPRHHQPLPLEQGSDSADRRPHASRFVSFQNMPELPRAPTHVRLPQLQHHTLHLFRSLVGMALRCPTPLRQSGQARRAIAPQPHIPGLPRDLVPLAELPHRSFTLFVLQNESKLLFHNTARFPWHVPVLHVLATGSTVSGMPPVQSVRDAPGPYRGGAPLPPECVIYRKHRTSIARENAGVRNPLRTMEIVFPRICGTAWGLDSYRG